MFVQQIIILSHKTYKLAHESQTRQNDYPNFVRILTVGVSKYSNGYPVDDMVPIAFEVATQPDNLRPVSFTMSEGEC